MKAQKGSRAIGPRLNYGAVKAERLPSVAGIGELWHHRRPGSWGAQPTLTTGFPFASRCSTVGCGTRAGRKSLSAIPPGAGLATRDLEQQVELDVRLAFDSINSAATEVDYCAAKARIFPKESLAAGPTAHQAGVRQLARGYRCPDTARSRSR